MTVAAGREARGTMRADRPRVVTPVARLARARTRIQKLLGGRRPMVMLRSVPKWARRTLWITAALVVAIGSLIAGALFWADSSSGREYIARRLESLASEEIAGKMRIGRIDSISLGHVTAHEVRFLTPSDDLVILARRVELDVTMLDLLRGHVTIDGGSVRGGSLLLVTDHDGNLGLDRAFRSARRSTTSGDGVTVDLDRLAVSDLSVRVRAAGVPDIHVRGLGAIAHIYTSEPGAPAQVRASGVTGHVAVATPIPFDLVLARGTVRFDGSSVHRARVDVRGRMGGSRMRLETTVKMGRDHPRVVAQLTVDGTMGWIRSIPLIFQATVADITSSRFDLHVQSADL